MRWIPKERIEIEYGTERIVCKFLWLPKKLYNPQLRVAEWRWWEHSCIRQGYTGSLIWPWNYWENLSWSNIIVNK